jgi:hypothetical protein
VTGPIPYGVDRGAAQYRLALAVPDSVGERTASDTRAAFDASVGAHDGDGGTRREATCRLRAATTLLLARKPDEAVAEARRALPLLHSARVRDDVHDLEQAAGPFRRRPEVADLIHDVASASGIGAAPA